MMTRRSLKAPGTSLPHRVLIWLMSFPRDSTRRRREGCVTFSSEAAKPNLIDATWWVFGRLGCIRCL